MTCTTLSNCGARTTSYEQVEADSDAHNERNDCAVKAIALVSNTPYMEVWKRLRRHGRRRRGTTKWIMTDAVLAELGCKRKKVKVKARTVRTLERELTRGTYLVRTRGHILAIINGVVCDWTRDRLHRIVSVEEIT